MQLEGKVIAITGGGRGIGRSTAEYLKSRGALVAVCARSTSDLKELAIALEKINDLPFITQTCDVTNRKQTHEFFRSIGSKWKKIDGLICAAGVYGAIGSFVKTPFEEWEKAININLKGTALTVHEAYSFFDKAKGGKIILYSGGGQGPLPNFSAYAASKGAISRLTETLGAELADERIYLNAIAPGAVNTQLLDELLKAGPETVGKAFYEKSIAQKEQGGTSPLRAAELTAWLLSEKSDGLYGKTLSAVWDPYQEFTRLADLSKSDIYQVRRVVDNFGNTRSK